MNTSRRTFLATVAAAACCHVPSPRPSPTPSSTGVRIGCITYSYRSMATTAEETLKALLRRDQRGGTDGRPIQLYAGDQ